MGNGDTAKQSLQSNPSQLVTQKEYKHWLLQTGDSSFNTGSFRFNRNFVQMPKNWNDRSSVDRGERRIQVSWFDLGLLQCLPKPMSFGK